MGHPESIPGQKSGSGKFLRPPCTRKAWRFRKIETRIWNGENAGKTRRAHRKHMFVERQVGRLGRLPGRVHQ